MERKAIRVDVDTHNEIKRLAEVLGMTVRQTIALAVRRLHQDQVGRQLVQPLRTEEIDWLDADLG